MIIGEYTRESGPDGMAAAKPLTESLRGLGPVSYTHLDVYKRQLNDSL